MSRSHSHLNSAKAIITLYKGEMPFAAFIKNFFAKDKKYGSKDRRMISSLCYNYFRLGSSLTDKSFEERLTIAAFLFSRQHSEYLQDADAKWNENVHLSLVEKIRFAEIKVSEIFPLNNHLSPGIDRTAFNFSFLVQPNLFVRLRPGKQEAVRKKLVAAQIPFEQINESCLAFANATKLEGFVDINRELVIQDLNSQRVGNLLAEIGTTTALKVWDCCAASGGKSIMAYDLLPKIELTVSDIRQSILQNLQTRFKEAGINNYRALVADVGNAERLEAALGNSRYDLIICDAPCSGSGTWSRTPEQLQYFKENEITRYGNLQKGIAANALRYLKKDGFFLYVTCSVFREENEEVVAFLQKQYPLTLVKMELLTGYNEKADTMFAALFQLKSNTESVA